MGRNRLRRFLAAITVLTALSCVPVASAKPVSPLCDSGSYRQQHPLICDTGSGPPGSFPGGGGGGGGGGLLGTIGNIVGGLTGGIL